MQADDKTTATQPQCVLELCGFKLSLSTVRRAWMNISWNTLMPAYPYCKQGKETSLGYKVHCRE